MFATENHTYTELSNKVLIEVTPYYVPERSSFDENIFFYAYKVRITNESDAGVKLLRRHWVIRDGNKVEQNIKGDGVVGEQPYLSTGESFEYTSFCPLDTPTGSMRGTYTFMNDVGVYFDATIPVFFLRRDIH